MQKEWKKPILNILTREKTEESVLLTCKQAFVNGAGPNTNNSKCYNTLDGCNLECSARAAS